MRDDRITVSSLGADIRSLRKARKMTLVELATALDRSVGWLSQVERDKSHPAIADLSRIAEVLDFSISSFLQVGAIREEEGLIVRADARRPIGSRTDGLTEELLSPDLTDDFEVIYSTFAPHSHLLEPLTRPTQEVCYIVSGKFEITLNGQRFYLKPGDSFRLRGENFQWWEPPRYPLRNHLGDLSTNLLEGKMTLYGRCECGAVTFEVVNARDTVTFCHCRQCRRTSGHYWASTRASTDDVTFANDQGLAWYQSSDLARRGFCKTCGSSLFYQPIGANHLGIAAGCLDLPTGMSPAKHIFTADAGDYYTIPDDAPHIPD